VKILHRPITLEEITTVMLNKENIPWARWLTPVNSSYSGGEDQEIMVQNQPGKKVILSTWEGG
jgi:hypothetical protein